VLASAVLLLASSCRSQVQHGLPASQRAWSAVDRLVEGYWAKNTGACVIPQCLEVISAVSRSTDHLDIFAVGSHAAIETAAWEPDFTDGWRGW
jgi:hypothetical protein